MRYPQKGYVSSSVHFFERSYVLGIVEDFFCIRFFLGIFFLFVFNDDKVQIREVQASITQSIE